MNAPTRETAAAPSIGELAGSGEDLRVPTLEAAGTRFGYTEYGSGDPLLFMHGYLGSSAIWAEVAPLLADTYRCVCIDARGVGGSDRPSDGYSVEQWAADVVAVADALGIDTFGYVGHSMGGLAGYQLALAAPHRLSALVGVCPAPAGPPRAGRAAFSRFRQAWTERDADGLAKLFAATSVRLPDGERTRQRGAIGVTAAAGHVDALLDAVAELDLRPRLSSIAVPSLLVLGAADPALAADLGDYQLLPNAALHVMSGVGHVPQLEAPDVFVDTLRAFLADGPITFATLLSRAE